MCTNWRGQPEQRSLWEHRGNGLSAFRRRRKKKLELRSARLLNERLMVRRTMETVYFFDFCFVFFFFKRRSNSNRTERCNIIHNDNRAVRTFTPQVKLTRRPTEIRIVIYRQLTVHNADSSIFSERHCLGGTMFFFFVCIFRRIIVDRYLGQCDEKKTILKHQTPHGGSRIVRFKTVLVLRLRRTVTIIFVGR